MSEFTIYHNPRCTKSRATLELLRQRGIEPAIVLYLETPPDAAELRAIVTKLGIEPEQLVRKGEDVYKSKYAGKALSDAQWIKAMVDDPVLIERPIVVHGERAVIGRPPENVESLCDSIHRAPRPL
jgi:arsenate reductase